jgi:hypothetical protein
MQCHSSFSPAVMSEYRISRTINENCPAYKFICVHTRPTISTKRDAGEALLRRSKLWAWNMLRYRLITESQILLHLGLRLGLRYRRVRRRVGIPNVVLMQFLRQKKYGKTTKTHHRRPGSTRVHNRLVGLYRHIALIKVEIENVRCRVFEMFELMRCPSHALACFILLVASTRSTKRCMS